MAFPFKRRIFCSVHKTLMPLLCRKSLKLVSDTLGYYPMISTEAQHAANKIVYRSLSNNIFENLALEEWIYECCDLSQTDVLLVWRSNPCVVIGKHQNPWIEANVPLLEEKAIQLARRSSGGGTVYHDMGNLNLSFLTDRSRYDRRKNLELVVRALTSRWKLDLSINDRDDIILDGMHKISGTAAKLTRNKSYHHFTVLHSVDRSKLSACLVSPLKSSGEDTPHTQETNGVFIESRSTKSVPAPVQNLQSSEPSLTMDLMVDAIVGEFLGKECSIAKTDLCVNPMNEKMFPGVSAIDDRLQSWDWIYGKTPKFSIKIDVSSILHKGDNCIKNIEIVVEKGRWVSFNVIFINGKTIDFCDSFKLKGVQMKRESLRSFLEHQDLALVKKLFSNTCPDMNVERGVESIGHCVSHLMCNYL